MRAVADVTRGVVRAQIDIEAPIELVYESLTEPAQLMSWWGGGEYETYDWKIDLRPGGAWSVSTRGGGGPQSVRGEYLEVEPPTRLVLTWLASWDGFARTVIEYTLSRTATGTRVTVVHDGFAGRPEACEGHAAGWHSVLGWLAAHAERHAS